MGLSISNSSLSSMVQRSLQSATSKLTIHTRRLASGSRIATSADDPAGLGISERMRARIRSIGVAERNVQDGISMVQTMDGGLQEISLLLQRMRELAVQASNGSLSTEDRAIMDDEFQSNRQEIGRLTGVLEYNGHSLLTSSGGTINIAASPDSGNEIAIVIPNVTPGALNSLQTYSIIGPTVAQTAIDGVDGAMDVLNSALGDAGAYLNQLGSALNTLASEKSSLSAAEGNLRDADFAFETAEMTKYSILQQAGAALLSQANVEPELALGLLKSLV